MQKIIVSLMALLLIACSSAGAEPYQCPASISANWSVPVVPSGWQTSGVNSNLARHFLSAVTFTLGPPSERAFLRPSDKRDAGAGKTTEVFELSPAQGHEGWLVCMYLNTPAVVFKPLAEKPQRCEVTYSDKAVSAIECK